MIKRIIIKTISAVMCVVMLFNGVSIPVSGYNAQPDASVKRITLYDQSGVLEGETLQLRVNIESDSTLFDGVEWSSSNPSAISCTADGKITGHTVGASATITCKARYGSAKDSINVVCVKKLEKSFKSGFEGYLATVYSKPSSKTIKDLCVVDFGSIVNPLMQAIRTIFYLFSIISSVNAIVLLENNVTVCGKAGSYAYIRYGENNSLDGFVKYSKLKNTGNAFLTLSATNMCVHADGVAYDSRKLTTNYDGNVTWTVEHENEYLEFERENGQITGLVPGQKAVITATADGETATCTIHLLYKWPQNWTGKTNRKTYIYYADGNNYSKGISLPQNTEFVVEGDCGTNSGWAYGYIKGTENWGFIPISHLSTKGTISYYNNLTTTIIENGKEKKVPWVWPMYDTSIKNISSPYGPRNITASGSIHHRGVDITTGNPGDIAGEYVVATCSGTVQEIRLNDSGDSCGFCISISTDCTDPITDKKISIIYMHLLERPKYENGNKILLGDYITVGTIIGKVGNTNGYTDSDMGYHLHFEANSQNASVKDPGRSDFTYTLNPMYFFVDKYVTFSNTNSYNKVWWLLV